MTVHRRDFITLLGTAAAAWPLAAWAQQEEQARRIGVLMGSNNNPLTQSWATAFHQELERLGWVDGHNARVEYRWAEGRTEPLAALAAEFVRLKVDVIVTEGTLVTATAKQATSAIPIVFWAVANPVGTGLVDSLARPGGNVTGLSGQSSDLAGKRVQLLREVVPNFQRLVILGNADNVAAVLETGEVEAATEALGVEVVRLEMRRSEDIAPALEGTKGPERALYIVGDAFTITNASRINTVALAARLPTIWGFRDQVDAGGLMSYGADRRDMHRRAAGFVDKILRGAKPGDLPVEQPTKFELAINLTTAKVLGLTAPPTLLAIADEVIE